MRTKQTDFDTFRRESAAALEAHIKAVARARRDADVALAKARTARDAAPSKAHLALRTALLANPLAASIAEAFANQRSQSEVDCEEAKAAILKQMRDDLAAIGHGHASVTV